MGWRAGGMERGGHLSFSQKTILVFCITVIENILPKHPKIWDILLYIAVRIIWSV